MALDLPHREVTVDTPREEWLVRKYKVSMIRDVLIKHLNNLAATPSGRQMRAMNRISMLLANDRRPEIANTMINWEADIPQISEDLDVLFFNGLVTRDGITQFRPVIGGLPTAIPGFFFDGNTKYDCPGSGDITINFDTLEVGYLADTFPMNRVQRRSKILGVLCHEMIHAFYMRYACQEIECCLALDGEWSTLVHPRDGHGGAWVNVAKYINMLFVTMCPGLEITDSSGYLWWRPDPNGGLWTSYRDALGVVENSVPGIIPADPFGLRGPP